MSISVKRDTGLYIGDVDIAPASGTIQITENGEHNVAQYAVADVEVPQPSGKIEITENGTDIDVAQYALADVNVPQGVFPSGTLEVRENGTYDVTEYAEVNVDDKYLRAMITGDMPTFILTIPSGTQKIRKYAFAYFELFAGLDLTNYTGTNLPESCFEHSAVLASHLNSNNTIVSIDEKCFKDCDIFDDGDLINGSLSVIKTSAFENCRSLEEVYLGNTITEIGDKAFYNSGVTDVYYTGSQSDWNNITIGTDAFPQGVTIHYDYVPTN